MPAPPEIRDAGGQVRIAEILHEREPEHLAEAARHVGIAGKVEVDLERIGDEAHPGAQYPVLLRRGRQRGPERAHGVGQQQLFGQPDEKLADAPGKPVDRQPLLVQLRLDVHISHDRPRDQLREHGHIRAKAHEIALRGRIAAIDVHDIGQDLEREERDADRQADVRPRRPRERRHERRGRVEQERGVFEHAQHGQIQRHGQHEQQLFAAREPGHEQADHPVDEDGAHHQQHIDGLPPRIEHQAGQQQKHKPPPPGQHIIPQQGGGQKGK